VNVKRIAFLVGLIAITVAATAIPAAAASPDCSAPKFAGKKPCRPDLVVTVVDSADPLSISAPGQWDLTITVTNVGSTPAILTAGQNLLLVRLSGLGGPRDGTAGEPSGYGSSTQGTDDGLLITYFATASDTIAPQGTRVFTPSTDPAFNEGAVMTAAATVDPDNVVAEVNERNNTDSETTTTTS
jgi:hypothetical protein